MFAGRKYLVPYTKLKPVLLQHPYCRLESPILP